MKDDYKTAIILFILAIIILLFIIGIKAIVPPKKYYHCIDTFNEEFNSQRPPIGDVVPEIMYEGNSHIIKYYWEIKE